MRIRQEQAFCDSEAAFPYKVKVLWSGILTTLGGGIARTSSLKKPGFSVPLYQKKSSMDKYVCAVQTWPEFLQASGVPSYQHPQLVFD